MAGPKPTTQNKKKSDRVKKKTSIGKSSLSRPKNKHKRNSWSKYRGQGK